MAPAARSARAVPRGVARRAGRARRAPLVSAVAAGPSSSAQDFAPCDPWHPVAPCSLTGLGMNQLEMLKAVSTVVADTGDINAMSRFGATDATTNPSLLLRAASMPEYQGLVEGAVARARAAPAHHGVGRPHAAAADELAVAFGCELLKAVPGRVSTEVDATLAHDAQGSVARAFELMESYARAGFGPERVYIKLAATWAGVEACRQLEAAGVACNMTLMFSGAQAAACADAGASLVSPFVGRILDWHVARGESFPDPSADPGVKFVRDVYTHYKQKGYGTRVMAASFRNAGEVRELAGCDNITVAPALLEELEASTEPLLCKLSPEVARAEPAVRFGTPRTGAWFYASHTEDEMAREKLDQGIEAFIKDQNKLEEMISKMR